VTRDIRVYVQSDGSDGPPPPELIAPTSAGKPWNSRSLSWRREGGEGDWAIYSARVTGPAPVASQLDDAQAKVDFTALGTADQIVRIHGTKHLLP
jgi:hypothetical protein